MSSFLGNQYKYWQVVCWYILTKQSNKIQFRVFAFLKVTREKTESGRGTSHLIWKRKFNFDSVRQVKYCFSRPKNVKMLAARRETLYS